MSVHIQRPILCWQVTQEIAGLLCQCIFGKLATVKLSTHHSLTSVLASLNANHQHQRAVITITIHDVHLLIHT